MPCATAIASSAARPLDAADADADEHEVGAGDRVSDRGRRVTAAPRRRTGGEPADDVEALAIDVEERNLVDGQLATARAR